MTSIRNPQLTVSPGLAVDLESPVERLLNKLDVLLVVEAEFLVVESLPVGSSLNDRQNVIASADQHSGDHAVVGGTAYAHGAEHCSEESRTLQQIAVNAKTSEMLDLRYFLRKSSPDRESRLVVARVASAQSDITWLPPF